ncbi:MAG: hypothetical protein ABEH77_07795 [Halobacteriaceae archaeon]
MSEPDPATVAAVRECERRLPPAVGDERLVFGFDGYLDRIREVVAERAGEERYARLETLDAFGEAVVDSAAADTSLSFEWRRTDTRTGGHTCHLARAFARLGFEPAMVGTYGRPPAEPFREAFDCPMHSLGAPGETDAVEFDDGKLLLTELGDTVGVDWETVRAAVGTETLADSLDGAALLGVGYWAELTGFASLVEGLRDIWPRLSDPPAAVLVDTGDLRKRDGDLGPGAAALAHLDDAVPVTVSANRLETAALASAVGDEAGTLAGNAAAARAALGVTRVAGHGVEMSVAVGPDGTASVGVPRTDDPALTTSAGDHFNAGLALLCSLDGGAAVALGNAAAGWFVRHGAPPTYGELREFVADYSDLFGAN